jgi:transcriptional regulator with XRE-family HTH domain
VRRAEHVERLKHDAGYMAAEQELKPLLELANDLLALRLQKGWSQEELAGHVGTRQANISRLENGLANPTLGFLQKVARALDAQLMVRLGPELGDVRIALNPTWVARSESQLAEYCVPQPCERAIEWADVSASDSVFLESGRR